MAEDLNRETAALIGLVRTIDGGTVHLAVEGGTLMIGHARSMGPEIEIGNLRVFAVDAVLPGSAPELQAVNWRGTGYTPYPGPR